MRRILASSNNSQLSYFKWHYLFASLFLASIAVAGIAALFANAQAWLGVRTVLWLLAGALLTASFAVALFALLLSCSKIIALSKDSSEQIETAAEIAERNHDALTQIAKTIGLSDAAKVVIFRDKEMSQLREAVLAALHEHDFDSTNTMIEFLSTHPRYADLSLQLRQLADQYQNATEDEQVNQTIEYIYELCKNHNWDRANSEVERLRQAFPKSAKAEAIGDKIRELKTTRKMDLLKEWDQAVKNDNTDQSLEILKELDLYLTANEGLALQESASEIFKSKLHNLGLEFTLAVSNKQWQHALTTGQQIIDDFPNSRMAHEINGKMHILKEKTKIP